MTEAYYFRQLDKAGQAAYHAMKTGLAALRPAFPVPRLEGRELGDVLARLRLDCPELFYVTGFSYRVHPAAATVELLPQYRFDKGKIQTHQKALAARLDRLCRPAMGLNEGEKERYVHDFICRNVRYDKLKKPYSHEILGPLGQGVGVCEGIAKAVKCLCDRLGVWCIVALAENNPDKGIKFSYYAAFWIRAYILKFIMDNWRMVKIGTTQAQRKLFYNLNRERQKLIAEGFDPDAATLAERLGVGEDQIVEMQQRLDASDMSLDATVGDESGSATRMDFLPALGPGIEESLAGMEIAELLQSKIRDILPSLSEKEAYILEHRLLTDDPVTLREIGERYNVTRERVRQLEARLLQKLKTHLSTDIQDFSEDWISH